MEANPIMDYDACSSSSNTASPSSARFPLLQTLPLSQYNTSGEIFVLKEELWSGNEGPFFARQEESVITFQQPTTKKFRMGGSRSSKFAPVSLFMEGSKSSPSLEGSRLDHTVDSTIHAFQDNSKSRNNNVYVRISGRGGAAARLCSSAEYAEPVAMELEEKPQKKTAQPEVPFVRAGGRGGLGSRPRNPDKSQCRAGDVWKSSKKRPNGEGLTVPIELGSRRSSETLSTIHFAGERGGPAPDFFAKWARKKPVARGRSPAVVEEEFDPWLSHTAERKGRSANKLLRTLGMPSEMLRTVLDCQDGASNRHENPSFLLTTFERGATQKVRCRTSTSSFQSDTSFDARSYFSGPFSGSSRSSTVSFGLEDDAASGDPADVTKIPFSVRSTISCCPPSPIGSTFLEQSVCTEDITPPPISITPPLLRSSEERSINLIGPDPLFVSASEAAALDRSKEPDQPFATFVDQVVTVHDAHESVTAPERIAERHKSWTGEWNARMSDVIQALRDLR